MHLVIRYKASVIMFCPCISLRAPASPFMEYGGVYLKCSVHTVCGGEHIYNKFMLVYITSYVAQSSLRCHPPSAVGS